MTDIPILGLLTVSSSRSISLKATFIFVLDCSERLLFYFCRIGLILIDCELIDLLRLVLRERY
jgi:hypothetical protein